MVGATASSCPTIEPARARACFLGWAPRAERDSHQAARGAKSEMQFNHERTLPYGTPRHVGRTVAEYVSFGRSSPYFPDTAFGGFG
jgi:hypothetical protein